MAMREVKKNLRERLAQPDAWPNWPLLEVRWKGDESRDPNNRDGTIHARMGLFRVIEVHPMKTGIKNFDEFPYIDYADFESLDAEWETTD